MTTIRSVAVAQDAASDPSNTEKAAQPPQTPNHSGSPRLRSCGLSLASQMRRMTALLPLPWRPPMASATALQLRTSDEDADAEAGDAEEPDMNERDTTMLEWTATPDEAAPEAPEPARSPVSSPDAWPDDRSSAPWEDEAFACARADAADLCPEVEAVNRQIEALPATISCEQLARRIRAHLEAHAGFATALVLLGDRSGAATDDSPAALVQALTTLHAVSEWAGPKRLLCEPAHHAGRAAAARYAAALGFEVLGRDDGIDRALRGARAVAIAGWRRTAALHQALAHTHATVGVVLVAPLASGDTAGARWMSHLLSAPGLLKIKPVDQSIGTLPLIREIEP